LGGRRKTGSGPPPSRPSVDESQVLDAILAEHQAIRAQILFQMGRANRLATLGIGAAGALLTTLIGLKVVPDLQFTVAGLVSAGLAVIALSYVGVVGEELQAADYLRDQGDFVRSMLGRLLPTTYPGRNGATTPPVLAWEELAARRTRAPGWVMITSSLAAIELAATVLFAAAVLLWLVLEWQANPVVQTDVNRWCFGAAALLTGAAIAAVLYVLRLQNARAAR
jgi:hypothetical protein